MRQSAVVLSALVLAACTGPEPSATAARAQAAPGTALEAKTGNADPWRMAAAAGAVAASDRVYLVSSRATFDFIRGDARLLAARRDRTGTELVVAEAEAARLPQISASVHRNEHRCGGYFAFDTLAQAEAFVREDRSAQALAAAAAYSLDNRRTVDRWLPRVEEARIRATIAHLSSYRNRYYASATGKSSAEWIRDSWQALAAGRPDVSTELFTDCSNCSTQPSVILTIQAGSLRDEVVVLGAHLDSINSGGGGSPMQSAPGADDDASGIAVLTEALRIALADGWRPKRTVKIMGYAAEEVGLRGSHAIAQSFRNTGVNVHAVLQVDMTNYKSGPVNDMRLISDYSNTALQAFSMQLFDTYLAPRGYTRGTYACGYACSDHASWTNAGYPSAMMFEAGNVDGFYPYIHSTSDTLATMGGSAQHSVKFAQFALAFLGETAKSRGPSMSQPLPPQRR
jgi:leucyl aminopeptidase